MLNNIFTFFDRLGYTTQKRAIRVQFSNSQLNAQVMLQRIEGHHAINEGLSAELICLSNNPFIELKQFIACQVSVDQVTDSGKLFRTTGIITGASQGQSDGAFTLYRLTMQDPTSLWHKRRNSRVFLDKSIPEILELMFKEWVSKSALFASSLKLDLSGLSKTYDVRPFSMQFNESDHTYLTRILREESINWLIDESNYKDGTKIENMQVALPDLNNPYILQYQVKNKDDQALSDKKYIVIDEDGNVYSGVTDQKGLMKLKTAPTSQTIVARVMVKDIEDAQEEISKD